MHPTRLLSCLATSLLIVGCATAPEPPKPAPTLAVLLQEAEAALKSGHQQQALAIFHGASTAYPRNKAAFMRIAQIQFECHNYGETIASAQQVLERDPDDMLAHSLVAVSGLRVSSKALSDLTIKNNLTGTVRAEAQDLAKLLRASIGGDIILPAPKARPATTEGMK
jgi:tetratricopeptide (TPR) repeat protein